MFRALVVIVLMALLFRPIFLSGQELHHHDGMTPEVDKFYSYWLQPNRGAPRSFGCCNRIDCYPTEAKLDDTGHWWFLHRESKMWFPVPDEKVEHLQLDPKESPDGRNHVCASKTGTVYCFVVGSQI